MLPKGEEFEQCVEDWKSLASDEDAVYDQEITIDGSLISPMVSWGTNPGMASGVDGMYRPLRMDIIDSKELTSCSGIHGS